MKNQIQIASEPKDSKLASTLAHETRKNNAGRILFLSLCVVVALAGAAVFTTSCNPDDDKKANEKAAEDGRTAAIAICECAKDFDAAIIAAGLHDNIFWSAEDEAAHDEILEAFDDCVEPIMVTYQNYFNAANVNEHFRNAFFTQYERCEAEYIGIISI